PRIHSCGSFYPQQLVTAANDNFTQEVADRLYAGEIVNVSRRVQPVAFLDADLVGKDRYQFRIFLGGEAMQDADASACEGRLKLENDAGAFQIDGRAADDIAEIEKLRIGHQLVDVGDEIVVAQILALADRRGAGEIVACCIEAQAIVGQLARDETPRFRPAERDGKIRFAFREADEPVIGEELKFEVRVLALERGQLMNQELAPEPLRHAQPDRSG